MEKPRYEIYIDSLKSWGVVPKITAFLSHRIYPCLVLRCEECIYDSNTCLNEREKDTPATIIYHQSAYPEDFL